MTAATSITCTKSEFKDRMAATYLRGIVIDSAAADEVEEVVNGLVRQANEHRGTFSGYNAYLDLDFTVTPDTDEITIPAVTKAQADQSERAAYDTVDQVTATQEAVHKILAAAGHLALAKQHTTDAAR